MTETEKKVQRLERGDLWRMEVGGEVQTVLIVSQLLAKVLWGKLSEVGIEVVSDASPMGKKALLNVEDQFKFLSPDGEVEVKLLGKVGVVGEDGSLILEKKKES